MQHFRAHQLYWYNEANNIFFPHIYLKNTHKCIKAINLTHVLVGPYNTFGLTDFYIAFFVPSNSFLVIDSYTVGNAISSFSRKIRALEREGTNTTLNVFKSTTEHVEFLCFWAVYRLVSSTMNSFISWLTYCWKISWGSFLADLYIILFFVSFILLKFWFIAVTSAFFAVVFFFYFLETVLLF